MAGNVQGFTICEVKGAAAASSTTWHHEFVPANVYYGGTGSNRFIEFGPKGKGFRIGQHDGSHMSVAHAGTKKTNVIYRADGTEHSGPRTDYNQGFISKSVMGMFGKPGSCPGVFQSCYVNGRTSWSSSAFAHTTSPTMYWPSAFTGAAAKATAFLALKMEHPGQQAMGYYVKYQVCKKTSNLVQTGSGGNKYEVKWSNCPKWGKFGTCAEQLGAGMKLMEIASQQTAKCMLDPAAIKAMDGYTAACKATDSDAVLRAAIVAAGWKVHAEGSAEYTTAYNKCKQGPDKDPSFCPK